MFWSDGTGLFIRESLSPSLYLTMSGPDAMQEAMEARFSNLSLIGRGSFGEVYKGWAMHNRLLLEMEIGIDWYLGFI